LSRRRSSLSIRCGCCNTFLCQNQPGTAANFVGTATNIINTNQVLARVDQNIGNRVRLQVRYNSRDEVKDGSARGVRNLLQLGAKVLF
jgi:hypothetical protein